MARHMCESSGRELIDKAIAAKQRELEPVTLLGMKCEIVPSSTTYVNSISDGFDDGRLGLAGSCARAAVLDLRTWYDYGDSAASHFVMLELNGTRMELGCLIGSDEDGDVPSELADSRVLPLDLSKSGQELIDSLPVSAQLRLFAQLVQATIVASKDARISSGDNYATYVGNPGALINFVGEDLGLLRLLRDSGHVDIELLSQLNWNHYIKGVVEKRSGDVEKKAPISVPLEFAKLSHDGWLVRTRWNTTVRQHDEIEGILANMMHLEEAAVKPTFEIATELPLWPASVVRAIRDAG